MSEVYGADDLDLGRRVALKLLAPDADSARFEREARAVAALAHPNVMQLYDYGEDNGRPYMVLEYVPGGTLEDRLGAANGAPLADADARAIAEGIAAGLAHAHSRGVVHRDLKPANVLFDDEGRPKLGDFGIARLAAGEGTLTEAGTVLGTAAYISPEQAAGEPASPASDVYSFGVILYRMLTGRLPFESTDPLELVLMNRDLEPPPVTTYREDPPGLLAATTMAALEKDPANRPADGSALLAALGAAPPEDATRVLPVAGPAPAGAGTAVSPARAAVAPPPEPPRSRLPLLAAAVLVLLLAGGALAYALTRPASSSDTPGQTIPTITLPRSSTTRPTTTEPQTTEASTTAPTTSTEQTTTQQSTGQSQQSTQQPTTRTTTQAPPATTIAPPTTTSVPAPATTTVPVTTTGGLGTTVTVP